MIMRARQDGNLVIFELEGHLDFDTTVFFQESCKNILKGEGTRIVFDLQKLRFVGSSGINQFIQAMKDFNGVHPKPRIMNASSEFVKIFKALQASRHPFEFVESLDKAIEGFNTEPPPPPPKKPRKRMARA